jgi:hypothetical protein
VIEQEKAPYSFKIHLFKNDKENGKFTEEDEMQLHQEIDRF